MQPSTLFPAEHRPLYLSYNRCYLQGTYLHEGPAQVDGCAAPVHGIIQDAEGEAGHFCLHQDAKIITCKANRGFLVRLHKAGSRGGLWHSATLPVPWGIPARDAERR